MNTNQNDCAFPIEISYEDYEVPELHTHEPGLTKREYFAALAMQGLLSNPVVMGNLAEMAVEHADALINELNK